MHESFSMRSTSPSSSLSLKIDETLTWSEQVEHITKKVTTDLSTLKRIRNFVDLNTLLGVPVHYSTLF